MNNVISHTQLQSRNLPLNAILIAQQSVLLPLYFFVPFWIAVLNLIAAGLVIYANARAGFNITKGLKVGITSLAIIGVYAAFEKFSGREAGVALITAMYGLKILETKTAKDAHLLLNLGFFMLVAGFLFSQKPIIAIYQFIPLALILNALITINSVTVYSLFSGAFKSVISNVSRYLIVALPIMLVLFVFFPRLAGPIWRMPGSSSAISGVSDSMGAGDISQLRLSDEIAFRATFSDETPNKANLYWRVLTLDQFDGFTWTRSSHSAVTLPETITNNLSTIDFSITLEPTKANYLVTLDHPVKVPQNSKLLDDFTAYANYKLLDRTRYSASAVNGMNIAIDLTDQQRQKYTRIPSTGNELTKRWALQAKERVNNDQFYIDRVLNEINRQQYFYTLQPPLMDENTIDSFWLDKKSGFCEHYAGAFVFLMRAAGIPARVVIGYQGGEKNPLTDYWIVRYANAHAWTEVWLAGQGWVRIDPTAAIAPERVEEMLLNEYRQRESFFDPYDIVELDDIGFVKQMKYWLDQVDNNWNEWVLDYNSQRQTKLFSDWGFSGINSQQMVLVMTLAIGIFVLILSFKWFGKRSKQEPLAASYACLLKKLGKFKGAESEDYDYNTFGPMDLKIFLEKQANPQLKPLITLLSQYIEIQYASKARDLNKINAFTKQVSKLKKLQL